MDPTEPSLRLIPLFPLAAALLSGIWLLFVRRELPRLVVASLACLAPIASFVVALRAVVHMVGEQAPGQRVLVDNVYTWISAHPFHAELSFLLDPLSAVMVLVVTGVGSLIHIYSIGYMDDDHREDRGFQRFFIYLNLFMFSMLMLVLGDNLLVMFVGWEGVGVCSYLLIGFWYLEDHNAMCGQKAFVVNRIGDLGFLLGVFLLFWAFYDAGPEYATIEFRAMAANIDQITGRTVELPAFLSFLPGFPTWGLLTLAGLCLFVGACGKSAQIPLYVWLPDAMAGPTPVSALIHAATMVTAGVYMVCRMSFAYVHAPGALATIAWVGAITALFAGLIGICQKDIKKVLAYSTVSQLGYMFLAAGVGSYSAAIFHLMTHAWFKALLFMGAGSVILGMHHIQDIEKMGGIARYMRVTHLTFLAGVVAICGLPPTSGFFSKDEILLGAYLAHDVPGHYALYAIGLFSAGITAFYMARLYFLVFRGENRSSIEVQRHIEEQSGWVTAPLVVLAALALVGGLFTPPDLYGEFFGVPESNSLHHFLDPLLPMAEHQVEHSTELLLAFAAIVMGLVGIFGAWIFYSAKPELPAQIAGWFRGGMYRLVYQKFYVDEIYAALIIRPLLWISDKVLYRFVDRGIIDGLGVNGFAATVRALADHGLKFAQTGSAQSYVFGMVVGSLLFVAYLVMGTGA